MPTSVKKVKGKNYLYFTYYDQQTGKKKEIYCGLNNTVESKSKALELELKHLNENKKEITEKITEVETELKYLSSAHDLT